MSLPEVELVRITNTQMPDNFLEFKVTGEVFWQGRLIGSDTEILPVLRAALGLPPLESKDSDVVS